MEKPTQEEEQEQQGENEEVEEEQEEEEEPAGGGDRENGRKRGEQGKRKRKGRSARRRSAKRRAIEVAGGCGGDEEEGDDDDEGPSTVADRHRTLPGALQRRMELFQEDEDGDGDGDGNGNGDGADEWFGNEELPNSFVPFVPYFDSRDVRWLQRELGFLPGNAVRVAVRKRRKTDATISRNGVDSADAQDFEYVACPVSGAEPRRGSWDPPVVLQLYPLAVRDIHAGGKSGRKFKSRKRGATANTATAATATTSSPLGTHATERKSTTAAAIQSRTPSGREGASDVDADDEGDEDDDDESENHATDAEGRTKDKNPLAPSPATANGGGDGTKEKSSPKKKEDWRTSDGTGVIEPFPTMYWLTDRCLRAAISRLELSQHASVRAMERRLIQDDIRRMEAAHGRYARQRWDLLTEQDRQAVELRAGGWMDSIGPHITGVAGIRPPPPKKDEGGTCIQPRSLKCLHAHAAHYLAGDSDNVVGKWVMELIQNPQKESHDATTAAAAK